MNMNIANAIAMLQQLQEQKLEERKERKRAYLRNYMKDKWANDPEFRDRHRASNIGMTYEDYIAKKQSGEIRRGRPRKVVSA